MEKTLVLLLGNARGGEDTWNSMYQHLLTPYNADLALCFGENDNKTSSLYAKAKFIWEIPEYKNWRDYYEGKFDDNWFKVYEKNAEFGLAGGIDNNIGSGAIIFAFRDFVLKNYKNILLEYDRIILTRSDYYYIADHPILPIESFYVVEGEDYDGITDRHHVFNKTMIDDVLGICDYLCSEKHSQELLSINLNPEISLYKFFNHNGILQKLQRFKRTQFTVSDVNDTTRWRQGVSPLPGHPSLKIKYYPEYETAIKNNK